MNGSITMETATDRALKLPLEPPFDTSDHSNHHHAIDNDEFVNHRADGSTEEGSQEQSRDNTEHANNYDQQKLVSLSPEMGATFISGNEASPESYGDERNGAVGRKRFSESVTDPSLTAAAAAAVASIQDVWSENFNEPLPTNKEERIQQALEFMRNEKHAHAADKNIKKHSIRQIALFFQVPKSTLYDRLKNRALLPGNDKAGNAVVGSPVSTYSMSSRAHSQQMKISMEKEEMLLQQTRKLCHALGNTINLTHLKDFITSLADGVSLGKKWVHNFTRRHDNDLIYGTLSSRFNVRVSNSKNCRCNFEYLWRCFIPLLQETIKKLPQDEPFYYITKTSIHQPSMTSIFTCFEVKPRDLSITLFGEPHLVMFPDYFGKSYTQRDLGKDPTTSIMNGHENIDHENLRDSDPTTEHIMNRHEKLQKHHKIDKLNTVFAGIYEHCCSSSNVNPGTVPLVVFEGFNDRYNWDPLAAKDMVHLGRFLAVPWNQQIFQPLISKQMMNIVSNITRPSSMVPSQFTEMETDTVLHHVDLDMNTLRTKLTQILRTHTETLPSSIETHDSAQDNELNVFASTLRSSPDRGQDNFQPTETQQQHQDNHEAPPPLPPQIPTVTSANIFENSSLSQLQDVINLIDTNEADLYRDLADPSLKTTLMDIFRKIKAILPQ
ncbi:hypothetical protein HG537_0A03060 [Torulaspora globosa]|uniref:Uncharacterized protein n=1 Tax=Torulaspora globosa TaxID=48254 RepID=A0A7H9HL65_9SACH|nr:hypothetical protein HG537_0A03060 [Torulaspora sp. CBS 2947]